MKRVVVTGATSFIGISVVKYLLDIGCECIAIVRPQSSKLGLIRQIENLRIILADVFDVEKWKKEIDHADLFFHLAWDGIGALGRADVNIQNMNVNNTMKAVEAAAELGCKRFIFAGSQSEYGIHYERITEKTVCSPVTEYGKAKLAVLKKAEKLCAQLAMDYVHLRIFSVYGPGDHPWTLVNSCIEAFCSNQSINLSACTQLWNYLHVNDAAEAIAMMGTCELEKGSPVYNVAGTETKELRAFVEEIWEACGNRGRPVFGVRTNVKETPANLDPDIYKIQSITGFVPKIRFEEGIRDIVYQWNK